MAMSLPGLSLLSTAFILRGMACIFLCLVFFVWPKMSLFVIQSTLWIYLLGDGGLSVAIGAKLRSSKVGFWIVPIIAGLVQIAGSFYFLANLDRMNYVALGLLSGILVLRALEMMVMVISPQVAAGLKLWLILIAIVSLLFSVLLLGVSLDRPMDLAKTMAIYQLLAGPLILMTGFMMRGQMQRRLVA